MPWGVAAATIVGAVVSADASRSAANKQADAAKSANATQLYMYDQNRDDQAPWRQAGGAAVDQLSQGTQPGGQFATPFTLQQFQQDPATQFAIQQGQEAIGNSAAAKGTSLSPNTLKDLSSFTVGTENQFYNQWLGQQMNQRQQQFNQLSSLAGLGQSSVNATGNAGIQTGNMIGQNTIGAGNALAAGQVGQANAWSGGLNNAFNQYMQMQTMQKVFGNGGGGTGGGENAAGGMTLGDNSSSNMYSLGYNGGG